MTTPDFRALLHPGYELGDGSADGAQQVGGQWWHPVMGCDSLQFVVDNALATPPPVPPKNCWLDDEPYLLPGPCVFDDPSEVISDCTYAQIVKCKTDCKYYRAATPPPVPPTDEELVAAFAAGIAAFPPQHPDAKHLSVVEYEVELEVRKARAVLERWGNH